MTHNSKLLRNLKVICSWDGEGFFGYQIQPHAHTVEGTLTKAWQTLTGERKNLAPNIEESAPNKIIGCSRLDSGVHAFYFVFNVFSHTKLSAERIVKGLNGILHDNLKAKICIYSCEDVDLDFHARYLATGKHYRYLIWHGFSEHQAYRTRAWQIKSKKSLENLQNILKLFEGTHDFNSFRASDCGAKNTIKTIQSIRVSQDAKFPELYMIDIIGDGFLKNLIRNMIGMAMLVINEKKELSSIQQRLTNGKKDYNLCAPAHALTLMQVYYPPQI